jgi:hypothetical protein
MGSSLIKAKDLLVRTETINRKLKALIEMDRRTIVLREDLVKAPFNDMTILRHALVGELDDIAEQLEKGDEDAGSRMIVSYEDRMAALLPYASRLHGLREQMEKNGPHPLMAYGKGRPMLEGIERLMMKGDLPAAEMGLGSLVDMLSDADGSVNARRAMEKDRGQGSVDLPRCGFCKHPVSNPSAVCPYCGFHPKADTKDCPRCGSVIMSIFDFCPYCSTKISETE